VLTGGATALIAGPEIRTQVEVPASLFALHGDVQAAAQGGRR
jgi:hypothetical protein